MGATASINNTPNVLFDELEDDHFVTEEKAKELLGPAQTNLVAELWDEIEPKGSVKLEEDIEEEAITGAQLRSAVVSKLDILEISNLRCVDLRDADYIGKSDPYVVLVLGRVGTSFEEKMAEAAMSAGGGMAKTHIMKNDLNPDYREWGCALELGSYLSHADLEVHVKVFDSDDMIECLSFIKDDVLGEATLKVPADIISSKAQVTLKNRSDKGAVVFNYRKTNRKMREELTMHEKMSAKVVDKDDIQKLHLGVIYGSPEYDAFDKVFEFEDCIQMCQMCRLSYWDPTVWASKKEGVNREYRPTLMSAPLRYLLGDFYRLNLLPTPNKFKVSTLDSAYDDHHSEKSDIKVSNGCFVDKKIDMQGMILQDDKTDSLVVVFRGTDTNIMLPGILSGALKDMRLTMITGGGTKDPTAPDSKGKVHRGMAKAYRRNFKTLVPIIERLWDTRKYKRIVVTGHSLGGALATIFIKGLYESVPSARSSLVGYTFGGYAIGDDNFMSEFNSKIPNFFRCINREDFVPHYVTPWWKGWRHVGVYIHMTDSKFFYNCEPFELKETDWESTTGSFFDPGTNHSLMAYSKNLEMYRCLNLMSEDQVNRCQKAWADVIRPVKAQTVGSLVGLDDNSVGTSVEFVNSVQPNFDLVPDHLDSEFEAEIEGHGKITIEEFEIMLRKGSLGHTHSFGKTEAVAWPSFVSCCYKLFYDPDKLSVSQRLEKGKFLAAFRKYDVDFDGFLNPEEFGEMCENEFKEMSKEEIVESAKKIDVDVDGYISEREFLIWGLVATDLTRR